MIHRLLRFAFLLTFTAATALGQDAGKPERPRMPTDAFPDDVFTLEGATKVLYKTTEKAALHLHVYKPEGATPIAVGEGHRLVEEKTAPADEKLPAVVCFHGSAWSFGSAESYRIFCQYLADRGIVAMSAEYRVFKRQRVTPLGCVEDAKSAIRFVRKHADRLGVDPERIAACGASAGGHIAACTALVDGFEAEGEDKAVSSKPNLVILQCAVFDMTTPGRDRRCKGRGREVSPVHHVRPGMPPMLTQNGLKDTACPPEQARAFEKAMEEAGNEIEATYWEGHKHGFTQYREHWFEPFLEATKEVDAFLVKHGWLEGDDKIEAWRKTLQTVKDEGRERRIEQHRRREAWREWKRRQEAKEKGGRDGDRRRGGVRPR